jgi:hypothetical protein
MGVQAGDDAPADQASAQEALRVLAQRETDMPVVLDDFTAGRHRSQRHRRLADFLDPAARRQQTVPAVRPAAR